MSRSLNDHAHSTQRHASQGANTTFHAKVCNTDYMDSFHHHAGMRARQNLRTTGRSTIAACLLMLITGAACTDASTLRSDPCSNLSVLRWGLSTVALSVSQERATITCCQGWPWSQVDSQSMCTWKKMASLEASQTTAGPFPWEIQKCILNTWTLTHAWYAAFQYSTHICAASSDTHIKLGRYKRPGMYVAIMVMTGASTHYRNTILSMTYKTIRFTIAFGHNGSINRDYLAHNTPTSQSLVSLNKTCQDSCYWEPALSRAYSWR
jgi:hypothetical protein